jgi:hypothetical protein
MALASRRLLSPEASSRQPSCPCAHVASALLVSVDAPVLDRTVRTLNVVTCSMHDKSLSLLLTIKAKLLKMFETVSSP